MAVHDGFATVRNARSCRPAARASLEPLHEEPPVLFRLRPDVPWWELATRRSRTRSCSMLQVIDLLIMIIFSIINSKISEARKYILYASFADKLIEFATFHFLFLIRRCYFVSIFLRRTFALVSLEFT